MAFFNSQKRKYFWSESIIKPFHTINLYLCFYVILLVLQPYLVDDPEVQICGREVLFINVCCTSGVRTLCLRILYRSYHLCLTSCPSCSLWKISLAKGSGERVLAQLCVETKGKSSQIECSCWCCTWRCLLGLHK